MTGQRIFTENTYRQTVSKIINLFIGVIVIWTWLSMTFRLGRLGAQSPGGFGNLRYFTVLSNLFQGIVSLIYFCGRKISRWKYASTTAIAFTFCIALFFLGPTRGYASVYSGANFWSHLVVPALAMTDFLFFDRKGTYTLSESLFAVIPMLLYGLFYAGMILIGGAEGNDLYGFARFGPGASAGIAIALLAVNWGLAVLLRLPRRRPKEDGKRKPAL